MFLSSVIRSNLDAILVQSRPADLDILIADLGSYDYAGLSTGKSVTTANSPVATANPQGSSVGMGSTQTARNGLGLTRKLSLEDLEWHSKDSKHNRSGSNLGIKFDSSSCKFYTKEGDDGGYTDFRGSPSISRTDSMGNDMYSENNGYDEHGLSNRGRSQSKDFDSLTSVSKLIRSTKKKLQSIEELEGRMKDGSLQDFNDEQVEKISKKEATQAEMKRLQLIFTRLEGEERVKAAAMAVREREKEKEKEKAVISSQCVVGKQGRDGSHSSELPSSKNISTVETIQTPARHSASSPSPTITPTSLSSQSTKSRTNIECKTSNPSKSPSSDLRSDASSTVTKKSVAVAERPVEALGKTPSSKATTAAFVPPSFNDWLKVTDEFVPVCAKIDQQPSLDNKTKIEPKSVWGLKVTAPQVRVTSETGKKTFDLNLNPGTGDSLPLPPHEISISHIGLQGRTVLSPPLSKVSNHSSSFPSSVAKTPIQTPSLQFKLSTSIQSNEGVKIMNRDQSNVEQQPVQGGSYSLSLADLLITPTKKTNKQKREAAQSVPASDKITTPEPPESKQKPSCPWLSPSTASPQEKTQSNDQIDTPTSNTSMKVKQKTLSEIQVEEEAARLQSNLISLKGNNNPWYQERRKRADSIEAVIRSQAEEKILDEANRIEEENAVRQVDLLKKKERRERGKSEKKKQETKSDAKPNVKVVGRAKKNPSPTINETLIAATEQPHSNCSSTSVGSETAVIATTNTNSKPLNESESGCGRRSPASKGQSGRPKDKGALRPNQRNTPVKKCITSPSVEDGYVPLPVSNALPSSVSSPSSSSTHNPTRTVNEQKNSGMKKTVGFHDRKSAQTGEGRQQAEDRSTGESNASTSAEAPTAQGRGKRNQQSHRDRNHRSQAPCDQNTTTHLTNSDNNSKLSEHIDSPSCVADVSVN